MAATFCDACGRKARLRDGLCDSCWADEREQAMAAIYMLENA